MKRAGLFAAYDYYPFGMIMPSRSVEDGSVQCIPVSRSRWVNLVNTGSNVITPANYNNSVSLMVPGGGGATATYGTFGMGDNAVYGVALQAPGGMSVSGTMDLTPLSSGAVGVQVGVSAGVMGVEGCDGTVQVDLYRVTLDAVTSAESLELLTSGTISGVGDLTLDVSEGVSGGDALRLGFSYSGSPVFTSPSMMGARVIIPSVITSVVTRVAQTYVTLSCDTDGAFRKDYRYGFNGKQKDNEIKGVGNSLDFGARMLDSRLGKWLSGDPLQAKYAGISPYTFALDCPIFYIDPDGNVVIGTNDKKVEWTIVEKNRGVYALNITSNNLDQSSDAYKVLSSLVHSSLGRNALEKLESTTVDIKTKNIHINTQAKKPDHGKTSPGTNVDPNTGLAFGVAITIFTNPDQFSDLNDRMFVYQDLPEEYYISAVTTHEVLTHVTDRDQVYIDRYAMNTPYGRHIPYTPKDEQTDYYIGIVEYKGVKIDIAASREIITDLHDRGVINNTQYESKLKLLDAKDKAADACRERAQKKQKEFDEKYHK